MKKSIKKILSVVLSISLISAFIPIIAGADNTVFYLQNFGQVQGVVPNGWAKSGYAQFKTYNGEPEDAPISVTDNAINATATGYGNRSAFVTLSDSIINPNWFKDYTAFSFDMYMSGGTNTCNILTLGYNQNDSYTDLSNTFFALGNGDGIGARDTLRYYNYNSDSWITIPNASNTWLKVKIYVDFINNKMAFELKDSSELPIGTYGPFSFDSKFLDKSTFNKIIMSAFRTNGGEITLNTWLDNFCISEMSEQQKLLLKYNGILPNGTMGADYELMETDGDVILNTTSRVPLDDVVNEISPVRVVETDFMVTALPTSGYQSIISFNDDVNGNVLINNKGALVSQLNSTEYEILLGNYQKIHLNEWYNLKAYIFLKNNQDDAYYTFVTTGDFGNGYESKERILETRNSDKFTKLNLKIGGITSESISSANVLYKNFSINAKQRPSLTFVYDDSKGKIKQDDNVIANGTVLQETIPKRISLTPESGYDVLNIQSNTTDILADLEMDFLNQGYKYTIPLKDESIILNINFEEPSVLPLSVTKETEPYPLDPEQPWEVRKYASETRTLTLKNAKMAYRLYKPVEYDPNADTKYPLVISLRAEGDGNTGFNNIPYTAGHVEDVLTSGQNAYDFPCFILSPQCYDENWTDKNWSNILMVLSIADILAREYESIDTNRIYIGGLSGGAHATWLTTLIASDVFAGAFIMSGTSPDTDVAQCYKDIPIWTFYAADDNAQRTPRTNRLMVDEIRNLGGNIVATEYPSGGHTIAWKEGLKSPLFKWLFAQEKGKTVNDDYIDRLIADYNNSINSNLNLDKTIASQINNDNCQVQETVLGDMVTDAMKYHTMADVAIIRSDYLGENINAGQITEECILNALPIKQNISVVEVTGADLMKLITNSLTYYPNSDGRFLQFSGMEVTFNPELRPSERILSITINGESLDLSAKYKLAVTNNLISNSLNGTYSGELNVIESYYQTIAQMFVNYLSANELTDIFPQLCRINSTD